MFDKLTAKLGTVYTNALALSDNAGTLLDSRLQAGPDINSDQGVDDAVWKIAAVAAVVFLAVGVLSRLRVAIAAKGDAAIASLEGLP